MRKKLLFRSWLLLALMLVGAGSAWGEVKSLYLTYSASSTVTGWSTANAGRFDPVILEENGNYYVSVNQNNRNNNGTTITGNILNGKAAAGDDFVLSFDLKLTSSSNQSPVEFVVRDAANTGDILRLTAKGVNASNWYVNGGSDDVWLRESSSQGDISTKPWHNVIIKRTGTTTNVTILYNGETTFSKDVTASATGGLGDIKFVTSRYNANFAIDNIKLVSPNVAYINAVDENGNVLEIFPSSTNGTTGENTQVAFKRIVEKDGKYYDCGVLPRNDNELFQKTVAYGNSVNVTYTYNSNIVYYNEENALNLKGSTYTEGSNDRASGGQWLDLAKNSYFYTKSGEISSGFYDISVSARGFTANQTLYYYIIDSSGKFVNLGSQTWGSSDYSIKTINDVFVPQGGSIAIYNTDTNNNRVRAAVDYLLVTQSTVAHTDVIPELSFSTKSATATVGQDFAEPTLSVTPTNYTGVIAYKSADESIARVNPLTGDVFLLDGTAANTPVQIIGYTNYTVNEQTYTISDFYNLTIKVSETEGEFQTVGNKATAYLNGMYGTRKVESVAHITMETGDIENHNNLTVINGDGESKYATTYASDGWHDAMFDVAGTTPIEGTYYTFKPVVGGHLQITGYMTGNSGVGFEKSDDVGNNLVTTQPTYSSASDLVTLDFDVQGNSTYYLFGMNPYYLTDNTKLNTSATSIGNADNSTPWWSAFSDYYSIAENEVLTLNFTNYTNGANPWNNWLLVLSNDADRGAAGYTEQLVLRADNWGWNGWHSEYAVLDDGYAEEAISNMNGAKVKITASRYLSNGTPVVMITVLVQTTDGSTYKKTQALKLDNSYANANIRAFLTTEGGHLTDITAHRASVWNVFRLHSFEFTPNYRYDYASLIFHDGNFYSVDDPTAVLSSDRLSVSGSGSAVKVQQIIRGVNSLSEPTYVVDAYGDVIAQTTTDGSLTIDPSKGGAYVINATYAGITARYILTIPYSTHKWKFGPEGTEPTMDKIQAKTDKYDSQWRFNARYKGKDAETNYMNRYDHPLIAAKTTINGDNVLYVDNSEGLLFKSTSGAAFGYAIDLKEGWSVEDLQAKKLAEKIEDLKASPEYQAMTAEEKAEAEAAVVVTAQDLNRILYGMYADQDQTTVENPTTLWMGYRGSSFTIPFAKAGQYVKIHWSRYNTDLGEKYSLTNLNDLEGNEITGLLGISGYVSGISTYTDPKGNYIFQVKNDGPVTITLNDQNHNNGWVTISDIELTDTYSTDLVLAQVPADATTYENPNSPDPERGYNVDLSDKPISLSSNGMTRSELHFSAYSGETLGANAQTSVFEVEPGESGVNVSCVKTDYFKSSRSTYYKYVVSADNNSGNGNVKLTQRIMDTSGAYVIDKAQNWIAVGTVTPQEYPRTWDFTAQNMDYATTSKASMSATADSKGYGEWSTDSETEAYANKNITKDADMYLHTYNVEGGDKPLFANGSELTAGGATFPETIGIGVTAWDAESADNISLSGSALTGVKAISVPMLSAGDYVYVMASSAPTATVTAYTKTTTDGKSTYEEADGATMTTQDAKYLGNGVYGFKVGAGENVNMDITFGASTDVYKVGVSNIEKTFDKYGFSTESRDKNIDYSFISAPAYAITESEFTYNYDKVSVTPTETFGITPAGQGVMLYNDALAEDVSPLFYAGNNILTGTENLPEEDVTLAGQNQLVAQLEAGNIAQSQQNSEGLDCDAFVLTYIYSTYSQSAGGDIKENQDLGTDAFFRVKGSIAAPANKAYLLVESDKLPKALWDGGNGTGTAGAVKNVVRINFGEEDNDTPTAIEGINIADNENLKDATWYNLSGQKLNGMPATKGVYIVNGKKVMVK